MKKLLLLMLSLFSSTIFNHDCEHCLVYLVARTKDLVGNAYKEQIEKYSAQMIVKQAALKKQISESQQYPSYLIDKHVRESYQFFLRYRAECCQQMMDEHEYCFSLKAHVPLELQGYLSNPGFLVIDLMSGNWLMNVLHFEILCVANELMKVQNCNFIIPRVNEFAKIALEYNRIGHADVAMMLLDFCWAVLDTVTCMKMKIEQHDNQDPIAIHLSRIVFGHYGIQVKPVKKIGSETELQREKLVMTHDIITERLQAIPTRNLVQTDAFANEDQLMCRVLQEVDLFLSMVMRSLGFEK